MTSPYLTKTDLMVYPNSPGWKGSDTSKAAAEKIEPEAGTLRDQVYRLIKQSPHGLTTDECARMMRRSLLSVRPRFSELRAQYLIMDSGKRRENTTGNNEVVWIASKNG